MFINAAWDPLPPPTMPLDRMDVIVAALDEQRIGTGSGSWVAQVVGVHTDGRDLWIQIGRQGEDEGEVVLRMPPQANPRQAIAALAASERPSDARPQVVRVMERIEGAPQAATRPEVRHRRRA